MSISFRVFFFFWHDQWSSLFLSSSTCFEVSNRSIQDWWENVALHLGGQALPRRAGRLLGSRPCLCWSPGTAASGRPAPWFTSLPVSSWIVSRSERTSPRGATSRVAAIVWFSLVAGKLGYCNGWQRQRCLFLVGTHLVGPRYYRWLCVGSVWTSIVHCLIVIVWTYFWMAPAIAPFVVQMCAKRNGYYLGWCLPPFADGYWIGLLDSWYFHAHCSSQLRDWCIWDGCPHFQSLLTICVPFTR